MKLKLTLILIFIITCSNFAQWQTKWTSNNFANSLVSGWINFKQVGTTWIKQPYYIDANKFYVMNDTYSSTVQYSYTFTQAEKDAGYLLYSLKVDLTGDGVTEFYVLSSYGTTTPYRQGMKIIDITNNKVLLELNDAANYYTAPTIWDVDNDGILECLVSKFNYPNFTQNYLIAYNTGISTSVATSSEAEKINFELMQNFPNPFNPTTNIQFNIEQPGNVNLKIYDITGKEVTTLINEEMNAGSHEVLWNGTDYNNNKVASGVYFYRLNYNGNYNTKKMLLLK